MFVAKELLEASCEERSVTRRRRWFPDHASALDGAAPRMGYDCPDGVDVAVDSCSSEPDDAKATCVVVRVDQPPKNGVEVTFTETYAALVKRIASCKRRPLIVLDGKLDFAP